MKNFSDIELYRSINDNCLDRAVIIRTRSAGVWFGVLVQKEGREVILKDARRMYSWWAKETISLSGVAIYGIKKEKSKIIEKVEWIWLEAIEILPCTKESTLSLSSAPNVAQE